MAEVSREDLHWDECLAHSIMGSAGRRLVATLAVQGMHSPEAVMTVARRLADLDPPLSHGTEEIPGNYDYFLGGVQSELAAKANEGAVA